jgi:hypothetical protein
VNADVLGQLGNGLRLLVYEVNHTSHSEESKAHACSSVFLHACKCIHNRKRLQAYQQRLLGIASNGE